ncbi:MAG: thiamine-monophosphate kinase [Verrucomicrobia bacterium]|nr:thiamine-monophosphate kinase [Verrucomicrobiota bacterium]
MVRAKTQMARGGEDEFVVEWLRALPKNAPRAGVVAGAAAGDDCAILRVPGDRAHWRLLKTDGVIEGVHFRAGTAPERVGWKALCRPLSDFAAMGGGRPEHALISLAWNPRAAGADYVRGIYAGLGKAARAFRVAIVGGETAATPGPLSMSVFLSGTILRKHCVRRGGGRAGDLLYVTGRLGGSFASERHLDFRPRLAEARWLTAHFPLHALMDLSDGLGADLPRLARRSGGGLGWRLDRAALPCAPGCDATAALNDGEDYELLFALAPRHAQTLERSWRRRFPKIPLTRIGELTAPGEGDDLDARGFDHFCARKA